MALKNCCMCLSLEEIDKYLKRMKLKTPGSRFQKLDRASRWLLGDYSAEDFIATDAEVDEHTAWVDRANLRQTFIDRICNGEIVRRACRSPTKKNRTHSSTFTTMTSWSVSSSKRVSISKHA